jgi:hypothetical protein
MCFSMNLWTKQEHSPLRERTFAPLKIAHIDESVSKRRAANESPLAAGFEKR